MKRKEEFTILDKTIKYCETDIFEVQRGKFKNAYKTVFTFEGMPGKAFMYYTGISISNGEKKRLICRSFKPKTIIRHFTIKE